MEASSLELFGRETETALLRLAFEATDAGSRGILLRGAPGIGKTALWRQALDAATEAGCRVLVARCAEVEMPLALSALADLLEAPFSEVAGDLPESQRRALLVALGLEDPPEQSSDPPEQRRILSRYPAERSRSSARCPSERRSWWRSTMCNGSTPPHSGSSRSPLDASLTPQSPCSRPCAPNPGTPIRWPSPARSSPDAYTEIELRGLTPDPMQQLVRGRLGLRLPRRLLAQIQRASGGNPMFALELARALHEPAAIAGAPLPVPDSLRELVRARVGGVAGGADPAGSAGRRTRAADTRTAWTPRIRIR